MNTITLTNDEMQMVNGGSETYGSTLAGAGQGAVVGAAGLAVLQGAAAAGTVIAAPALIGALAVVGCMAFVWGCWCSY